MAGVIVRVDEAAISGLFDNHGPVGRFAGRVANEARVQAGFFAPKRTGRLAASLRGDQVKHYTFGQRVSVRSDVPYAAFVEDGTTGPIVSDKGGKLWVPMIPHTNHPRHWRVSVRGQPAQHFIARGIEGAFALNGIAVHVSDTRSALRL